MRLEHFGTKWYNTTYKYLPINPIVSSYEVTDKPQSRCDNSRGRASHFSAAPHRSPKRATVTVERGCQRKHKFCPCVHFTHTVCQPWQPLRLYGLMRWLNSSVWHLLPRNAWLFLAFLRAWYLLLSLICRKVCIEKSGWCFNVCVCVSVKVWMLAFFVHGQWFS